LTIYTTPCWDSLDLMRLSSKTKRLLFFYTRQGFWCRSRLQTNFTPLSLSQYVDTPTLFSWPKYRHYKGLHVHAYFFYWAACVYDYFSLFICWVICVCCCLLFIFTLFAFVRLFVFTQYGNNFVSNKLQLQPMVE
jgi:hypothetical protein